MTTLEKVLISFIGGAAVGAAAALLLAPQSGEKTREDLKKFMDENADKLAEMAKTKGSEIKETIEKIVANETTEEQA